MSAEMFPFSVQKFCNEAITQTLHKNILKAYLFRSIIILFTVLTVCHWLKYLHMDLAKYLNIQYKIQSRSGNITSGCVFHLTTKDVLLHLNEGA